VLFAVSVRSTVRVGRTTDALRYQLLLCHNCSNSIPEHDAMTQGSARLEIVEFLGVAEDSPLDSRGQF
jgi:hypothetical protein